GLHCAGLRLGRLAHGQIDDIPDVAWHTAGLRARASGLPPAFRPLIDEIGYGKAELLAVRIGPSRRSRPPIRSSGDTVAVPKAAGAFPFQQELAESLQGG